MSHKPFLLPPPLVNPSSSFLSPLSCLLVVWPACGQIWTQPGTSSTLQSGICSTWAHVRTHIRHAQTHMFMPHTSKCSEEEGGTAGGGGGERMRNEKWKDTGFCWRTDTFSVTPSVLLHQTCFFTPHRSFLPLFHSLLPLYWFLYSVCVYYEPWISQRSHRSCRIKSKLLKQLLPSVFHFPFPSPSSLLILPQPPCFPVTVELLHMGGLYLHVDRDPAR